MSTNLEADEKMMCCAGCGKAEVDDIKLRKCNGCKSVRYCGVKCQREHRPKHKRECKNRVAELRDELLFKQPESSHLGDCPICFLPLPLDPQKCQFMACCSKLVCEGCEYANQKREIEQRLHPACPFCRHPAPESKEEADKNVMKRVEANDPVAMFHIGKKRCDEGDFDGAFEYWTKAAELGDAGSHYNLSNMYDKGEGVEKDEKKQVYHLEEAAIGGEVDARLNLAKFEWDNGRRERAVKHWIIAVNFGHDFALKSLRDIYTKTKGLLSKEDFAAALRAHQAAVDATKSPQREVADAYISRLRCRFP